MRNIEHDGEELNGAGGPETNSDPAGEESSPKAEGKYPEWDRLQEEVVRQLRANRRFLERCLDEEFMEEDEPEEDEAEPEDEAPVG